MLLHTKNTFILQYYPKHTGHKIQFWLCFCLTISWTIAGARSSAKGTADGVGGGEGGGGGDGGGGDPVEQEPALP